MKSNSWQQFLDLLPADPLWYGEVVSRSGQNYTIELPGGEQVSGIISATVYSNGTPVFFQNGQITGQAPSLPYHEVSI